MTKYRIIYFSWLLIRRRLADIHLFSLILHRHTAVILPNLSNNEDSRGESSQG